MKKSAKKNSFKIFVKNLAITEKYLHLCNAKIKTCSAYNYISNQQIGLIPKEIISDAGQCMLQDKLK
jgi:hypothetical protein